MHNPDTLLYLLYPEGYSTEQICIVQKQHVYLSGGVRNTALLTAKLHVYTVLVSLQYTITVRGALKQFSHTFRKALLSLL